MTKQAHKILSNKIEVQDSTARPGCFALSSHCLAAFSEDAPNIATAIQHQAQYSGH